MLAKTHRRLGVTGGLGVTAVAQQSGLIDLWTAPGALGACAFMALVWHSSVWPDIDMPKTTPWYEIRAVAGTGVANGVSGAVGSWAERKYRSTRTSRDRNRRNPKHRTASHTLRYWVVPLGLAAAVLAGLVAAVLAVSGAVPSAAVPWSALVVGGGVLWGNLMHLVGDGVTDSSVPWLAGICRIRGQAWYCFGLLPKRMRFTVGGDDDPARPGRKKRFQAERHLWAPGLLLANAALAGLLFPPGLWLTATGVALVWMLRKPVRKMLK